MILSRIIHHLKTQNWTAVAIEFVIVIAGVVIGFQVTAWNSERQDRVDETRFIDDLHDDIVLAEFLSARVRDRRLQRLTEVSSAIETVYGRSDHDDLTSAECSAIASMQYFNINVPDLTSFTELADVGRIDIVRDPALRHALVAYRQSRGALRDYISIQTASVHNLSYQFSELISVDVSPAVDAGEIRNRSRCDLAGMRESRLFLNAMSQNADAYDAYVRDGLGPWSDQLDRVHARVDTLLGLSHDEMNP